MNGTSKYIYIRNTNILSNFIKSILKFVRPSPSSTYNCLNCLKELNISPEIHKFMHSLLDSLNPICSCGWDLVTNCHYLLHCPYSLEHCFKNKQLYFDILWGYRCKTSSNGDESLDLVTKTIYYIKLIGWLHFSKQKLWQSTYLELIVMGYTLPPWRLLPSSRCLIHAWGVRINDVVLWVLYAVPLPSSFISVSENIIFHLQRRKLQRWPTGEKTIWHKCATRKDDINWYRM